LIIAHAPSSRATKGTDIILRALNDLGKRHPNLDVDLIEGVGHNEALRRLARADIVVEKCLGDGYGTTAIEAMALGKPVVTRFGDYTLDRVPGLPALSADPDALVEVLGGLIRDGTARARLSAQGRRFAEDRHSLKATALDLERLYTGGAAHPDAATRGWSPSHLGELEAEVAALRRQVRGLEHRNAQSAARPPNPQTSPALSVWRRLKNRLARRLGVGRSR
jgi:hypothetical protein